MNVDTRVRRVYRTYCSVCEGKGGWDRRTYQARFERETDTKETYMSCIWCGVSNSITGKVT